MTDIFREVEEDVRRERVEQIWKQYGDYIIAGAALIIIAVAAFQLWRIHERQETERASLNYELAQQLMDARQPQAAEAMFAKLAATAPGGYAQLAEMQKANALSLSGSVPEAVVIYRKIAAKGDPLFAAVARIRAGWAIVDTAPRIEVEALLKPILAQDNPWHPMAREILAYSDYRSGASAQALAEFRDIEKDRDAPSGERQRAEAMATFLGAGGDRNYGTVPPPQPEKPQAQLQGAPQK